MFKFENLNKMHTISDFEQLSGIHTHTNRMLERRHKALIPHRYVGNTRYFDDRQQLRLLNIVNTKRTKLKIAIICTSSPQNIQAVLDQQNCETVSVNQKNLNYKPWHAALRIFWRRESSKIGNAQTIDISLRSVC